MTSAISVFSFTSALGTGDLSVPLRRFLKRTWLAVPDAHC